MKTTLDILHEDEHLLVINKPSGVLSQPGKTIDGSVATQIRDTYPQATGPMLVHRLDMDTSGLMLFAKSRQVHRDLQQQFENRNINKRYTALLSRAPTGSGGQILLPLRADIENRPSQIVCFEHGKQATTLWRLEHDEVNRDITHVQVSFVPITGRTHQLRVHAAHPSGLDAPIVGDRLYGKEAARLMLHADRIGFTHPVAGRYIQVECPAQF